MSELEKLLRLSVDEGCFPDELKDPWICPIWKGESRALPVNYRPVSLVSNISKVLEKVVRKQMVDFLEENDLVDVNQHGALHGRSTLTQLLDQQQEILKILENGEIVEVIYLNFSKAFDSCNHSIMLRKMRNFGFSGNLLRWIASFLTGRK